MGHNTYVYNESSQLAEVTLCDGRKTVRDAFVLWYGKETVVTEDAKILIPLPGTGAGLTFAGNNSEGFHAMKEATEMLGEAAADSYIRELSERAENKKLRR